MPSPLDGLRDTLRYDAGVPANAATASVTGIPGVVRRAGRRPVQAATSAAAVASSVYRIMRPIAKSGSSLMKDRTTVRRLGIHEVSRLRLRDAGHAGGGSLNDAFLAGVTGALRRYHEKHSVAVGEFHVGMPISLRTEGDAIGGNRVTMMRFDVPVGLADPARRIEEIHHRATRQRDERSLPYMQLIAGALNVFPRWYIGAVLRRVDFVASDVPGIPIPVRLGGAALRMAYGFGPTIGAAVNVTLLSYVDTCALGINVDAGAIPDFDVFQPPPRRRVRRGAGACRLVVTPVSSSGLCRDSGEESVEVVAVEAPVEWSGGAVVAGFERAESIGQHVEVGKVVGGEQLSL